MCIEQLRMLNCMGVIDLQMYTHSSDYTYAHVYTFVPYICYIVTILIDDTHCMYIGILCY